MTWQRKKWLIGVAWLLVLASLCVVVWQKIVGNNRESGLVSGNGRIEAVEIDVATKYAGRIKDILVREGEFVTAGQVVATMDTEVLEAQLRQAEAQLQQAQSSVVTARSQLAQRESEKAAELAAVRQREAELVKARQHWDRSADLVKGGAIPKQDADDDYAQLQSAMAAEAAARSQVAAAEAAIATARSQIGSAESNVEAARANAERIRADIKDSALRSPRDGRVQYRVAQIGEVVGAGGRVLSLVDLNDVYMTFFLPTAAAGKVALGTEVRLVLDAGLDTFALDIPPSFQRDVLAGRSPAIQLNMDATRMSQAFTGSGYIQTIINSEVASFLQGYRSNTTPAVDLALRVRFNPQLNKSWFGGVNELINKITMLSLILTGAALLREREHGTVEHLLVMPVTPFEIMAGKVWAMALVSLVGSVCSLFFVVQWALSVPIEGSIPLFLAGTALHLFATTSLGIFLATLARSMPQFGLLMMLILLPLQILSGGTTPRESMPAFVQFVMLVAPTTHFVKLAQAILFRGAGFAVVCPQFIYLILIGSVLFAVSLARFRKTIEMMA